MFRGYWKAPPHPSAAAAGPAMFNVGNAPSIIRPGCELLPNIIPRNRYGPSCFKGYQALNPNSGRPVWISTVVMDDGK